MTEDNVVDLNTEILIGIRDELRALRGELHQEIGGLRHELKGEISAVRIELKAEIGALRTEMHGDIGSLRAALDTLEQETIRGFTGVRRELVQVNERLDSFIGVASGGHRDHERRIVALEGRVPRKASRRRPPER